MVDSDWLTASEAADYLRCKNVRALYNLCYRAGLPHTHAGGLRLKKSDIDAYMARRTIRKTQRHG